MPLGEVRHVAELKAMGFFHAFLNLSVPATPNSSTSFIGINGGNRISGADPRWNIDGECLLASVTSEIAVLWLK